VADLWPLSDENLNEVTELIKQLSNEIREERGAWNADKDTINLVVEDGTVLFVYIWIISKTINKIANSLRKLPSYHNSSAIRSNHTTTLIRDDKPLAKSFHLSDFKEKIEKYPLIYNMIYENTDEWMGYFATLKWKIVISTPMADKMAFPL
jgi:hypothetical protein